MIDPCTPSGRIAAGGWAASQAADGYIAGDFTHHEAHHDDRFLLLRKHDLLLHLWLRERPLLRQVLLRSLTRLHA